MPLWKAWIRDVVAKLGLAKRVHLSAKATGAKELGRAIGNLTAGLAGC